MKGIYLNKSDSYNALGLTFGAFAKVSSKFFQKEERGHVKFFIPLDEMQDPWKEFYSDKVYEVEDDAIKTRKPIKATSDSIDKAISEEEKDFDSSSIEGQILLAKLENIKQRTASLKEKTVATKRECWNRWSETFVEAFEDAFSIFKNDLINLHLSEVQTNTLKASLSEAVKKMEKKLKQMVRNAKLEETQLEETEDE